MSDPAGRDLLTTVASSKTLTHSGLERCGNRADGTCERADSMLTYTAAHVWLCQVNHADNQDFPQLRQT